MVTDTLLALVGIVGPALVLIIAVRRWLEPLSRRVGSLMLGMTLVFLGSGAFKTGIPVPLDEAARGYPVRGVAGELEVGNPLPNETARQFPAWMHAVREAYRAGRAPLWNRYANSGTPLLGNGQSAPFSVFFLTTIFVPLPKQLVAIAGLKIFVALLFGYLLLRREGVSGSAAVLGSSLFAMSLFQNVFLFFPKTGVSALLPGLLYAVGRTLDRPEPKSGLLLGLITAGMLAGGHPETVFHCAVAAAAYLLIEATAPINRSTWRRAAPAIALSLVWAAMLSAPGWLPLLEQIPSSARMAEVNERKVPEQTPVLPAEGLPLFVNPDHFGHPARGTWSWRFNYAEVASVYVGLVPLALLGAGILSRRGALRDRILFLSAVFFVLVAFNWTPIATIINRTAPFGWAANNRLRFVAVLLIAILTARTLDRIRRADLPLVAGGVVVVGGLFIWSRMISPAGSQCAIGAIPLVGFAVACLLLLRFKNAPISGITAAFVTGELILAGWAFHPPTRSDLYAPRLPIIESLREHVDGAAPYRVTGTGWTLTPDMSTIYGLEDIRGNDPMANHDYLEFLDLIANRRDAEIRLIHRLPHPGLDFLNVKFVLTRPGKRLRPPFDLIYSGVDGRLYSNPNAIPRFFSPATWRVVPTNEKWSEIQQVADFRHTALLDGHPPSTSTRNGGLSIRTVVDDGFGVYHLEVVADQRSLIVSSLPNAPGWRLAIDRITGPIETVNGAFVGFFVPDGQSTVTLRYRPWSFDAGLLCFAMAVIWMVLVWIRTLRTRHRDSLLERA